jgi:carbamoyltransferase
MSAILGISAYYHDSAAALIVDGQIVAAMQEERFSRRKNDAGLPRKATQACLEMAGLRAEQLDKVVFYENPYARLERVTLSCFNNFPRAWRQFPSAMRSQIGIKIWVLDALAEMLNLPRSRIEFTDHHRSHAASAFFASSYESAAVLTIDGMGEDVSSAIWHGNGTSLKCLHDIAYPHSIGLLYAAITAYLGFEVNEGEYKVMGLAAFGTPRYKSEFLELVHMLPNGEFKLDMKYFAFHTDADVAFSNKLERLLGPRRMRGKSWDINNDPKDGRFADIAASLQWITEELVLRLAHQAQQITGEHALCLAGGVALNCVANARVLRETKFQHVFVQPAAGDAGGALGAAMQGWIELTGTRPQAMSTAALGTDVSNDRTRELCRALDLTWEEPADPFSSFAQLIGQGKVGAFVRGRFEWGPRALGQRSILASPCDSDIRERINRMVKKREPFRPFAPAVLREKADDWFYEHDNDMTPFMTTTALIHADKEARIGAVRHVDGSARVQTVDEKSAVDLCHALRAVDSIGLPPILLNTSLNANGEPIVASEADALAFYLVHPLDFMLLGDVLLTKGG